MPEIREIGAKRKMPASENAELQLLENVVAEDVVITSTLTNFSMDFISALQTVLEFDKKGVRVISLQEEFDSSSNEAKILLTYLPLMHKFRRAAFLSRRKNVLAGIEKAASEGKYKGRQAYNPEDFPNFRELYNSYMYREISKGEFANKLGVSRPTLDKLIEDFTTRKDKN